MTKWIVGSLIAALLGGLLWILYAAGGFYRAQPIKGEDFMSSADSLGWICKQFDEQYDPAWGIVAGYVAVRDSVGIAGCSPVCVMGCSPVRVEFYELQDDSSADAFYRWIRVGFNEKLPAGEEMLSGLLGNYRRCDYGMTFFYDPRRSTVIRVGATVLICEDYNTLGQEAIELEQLLKAIGYEWTDN